MAVTTKIPETQLFDCFDRFTKRFPRDDSPEYAFVEVLSPEWGDQLETSGERLLGVTYEPKKNTLEFELQSGDHRVFQPKEVWVLEEQDGFISSIEVVRPDGAKEVVSVKRGDVKRR